MVCPQTEQDKTPIFFAIAFYIHIVCLILHHISYHILAYSLQTEAGTASVIHSGSAILLVQLHASILRPLAHAPKSRNSNNIKQLTMAIINIVPILVTTTMMIIYILMRIINVF